jgi:hypothetical protein
MSTGVALHTGLRRSAPAVLLWAVLERAGSPRSATKTVPVESVSRFDVPVLILLPRRCAGSPGVAAGAAAAALVAIYAKAAAWSAASSTWATPMLAPAPLCWHGL